MIAGAAARMDTDRCSNNTVHCANRHTGVCAHTHSVTTEEWIRYTTTNAHVVGAKAQSIVDDSSMHIQSVASNITQAIHISLKREVCCATRGVWDSLTLKYDCCSALVVCTIEAKLDDAVSCVYPGELAHQPCSMSSFLSGGGAHI